MQVPVEPLADWHPPARERLFSPERDDVMRRGWPTGVLPSVLEKEINALPGPQVTKEQITTRARSLYLRRPEGFASVLAKLGGAPPGTPQKWTPERIAIVVRDYPGGRDLADLAYELSALGPGTLSPKAVKLYANKKLKLKRIKKPSTREPGKFVQEPCAFAAAPRPAPPTVDVAHCPPEAAPGADGLVEAVYGTVWAWAEPRGIWFNGTNVVDPCAGGYGVLDACRASNRTFIGCDLI